MLHHELEVLLDLHKVHVCIVILHKLHADKLILCINQKKGALGSSIHFDCIPHFMHSLEVFDLVADMGGGGRKDHMLSEIFTLVVIVNPCLPSLDLIICSRCCSVC